eukprot:scaffold12225_cov420-Ochromonas_danica.AAC.1
MRTCGYLEDVVHMNAKQADVPPFSFEHYAIIIQAFFVSNITEGRLQVLLELQRRLSKTIDELIQLHEQFTPIVQVGTSSGVKE